MSIPALVLGAGVNGLGVARSLACEGVQALLVDAHPAQPTMRTRHAKKLTLPALSGAGLAGALLDLRAQFSADPVLFLTQEETVKSISAERDKLASRYRLAIPPAGVLGQLMDKAQFQSLAQRLGFPIPRAVHLATEANLDASASLAYPCVLKPIVKTSRYDRQFKKAYKVDTVQELRALVHQVGSAAEMIAQEWIEGGDDRIYFCLQYRNSAEHAVATFTGRKLRSWPPRIGGTASCVPAPEASKELTCLTNSFFSAVGCFGLCSMEFKRDARTGQFLMIEPTVGRTDFQEEIATLNGINIPYAAYCSLLGRRAPPPRRPPRPAAWPMFSKTS